MTPTDNREPLTGQTAQAPPTAPPTPPSPAQVRELLREALQVLQHASAADLVVQRSLQEIVQACEHAKSVLPGAASPQQVAENILGKIRGIAERIANKEFPQYVAETAAIIHVVTKIVVRMEAYEALGVRTRLQVEGLQRNSDNLARRLAEIEKKLEDPRSPGDDADQLTLTPASDEPGRGDEIRLTEKGRRLAEHLSADPDAEPDKELQAERERARVEHERAERAERELAEGLAESQPPAESDTGFSTPENHDATDRGA